MKEFHTCNNFISLIVAIHFVSCNATQNNTIVTKQHVFYKIWIQNKINQTGYFLQSYKINECRKLSHQAKTQRFTKYKKHNNAICNICYLQNNATYRKRALKCNYFAIINKEKKYE